VLPTKHCISIQDLVIDLHISPAGNKFRASSPLHCLIEKDGKKTNNGEVFTIDFSVSELNGGELSFLTSGFEARVRIRFRG
jgi:hypothetical protein